MLTIYYLIIMAVEETSCPKEKLEEKCSQTAACQMLMAKYEECAKRVGSRPGTAENCREEMFDFTICVDHCVL